MTQNLSDFMPDLLAKARELQGTFAAIAMVLVFAGVIAAAVKGTHGDVGQMLRTVCTAGMIAVVISAFPGWVDELQLMAHALVKQLDADPSESHTKFAALIAGPDQTGEGDVGFWDVLWSDQGGIGKAVMYAIILIFARIAMAVQFLCFLIQQIILIFGISVSPIFLGMLMLNATREIGIRFLLSLIAVISWPVSWAVADLVTSSLLKLAASENVYNEAGGFMILSASQGLFLVVILSLWILISSIAAPYALTKALQAGSQIGGGLLASFGAAIGQGASYGLGAGVTSSMSGASRGVVVAASVGAGLGGVMSGAAGSSGMVLPAAIGTMAVMAGSTPGSGDFKDEASEIVRKERAKRK